VEGARSDISAWPAAVARRVAADQIRIVRETIAAAEVESTQDAAWEACRGRAGLLVVADVQRSGRGRLGRSWVQAPGMGLACTFTLSASEAPPGRLSLIAGVATAQAIEAASGLPLVGLRWPNDVVERGHAGRKVAGVLIERRGDLALVGIGINIVQREEDFPEQLRGGAASVAVLAPRATLARLDVLLALIMALDRLLTRSADAAIGEWQRRDVVLGTRRTFLHDGRAVTGRVIALDPLHLITVQADSGQKVRLPALTTSLVHER